MSEDAPPYRAGLEQPFRVSLTYTDVPHENVGNVLELIQLHDGRAGAVASSRADRLVTTLTVTVDTPDAETAFSEARALVSGAVRSLYAAARLVGIEVGLAEDDE